MQHERLIADLHGMAGVVSALVARNDLEALGKQIDDLAFSFIAPLGADDCNYFRHKNIAMIRSPGTTPSISSRRLPRNYRLTFHCAESFATARAAHKSKGLRVFFQAMHPLRTVQT